jgi:hypothetical protein
LKIQTQISVRNILTPDGKRYCQLEKIFVYSQWFGLVAV